jgi:hypothetical protein
MCSEPHGSQSRHFPWRSAFPSSVWAEVWVTLPDFTQLCIKMISREYFVTFNCINGQVKTIDKHSFWNSSWHINLDSGTFSGKWNGKPLQIHEKINCVMGRSMVRAQKWHVVIMELQEILKK